MRTGTQVAEAYALYTVIVMSIMSALALYVRRIHRDEQENQQ